MTIVWRDGTVWFGHIYFFLFLSRFLRSLPAYCRQQRGLLAGGGGGDLALDEMRWDGVWESVLFYFFLGVSFLCSFDHVLCCFLFIF